MQQYKSSRNTQLLVPRAHVSQELSGFWGDGVMFSVRIMVSLCELFWSFWFVFGVFFGNYLSIFSSHNGIEVTWMTL